MGGNWLMLSLWLVGCAGAEPSPPPVATEVQALRTVPTPLSLDITEIKAHLGEASGHVRIYAFWASWCGPCLAEFPDLREFALKRPGTEVVLVNVDFKRAQEQQVPQILKERGVDKMSHLLLDSTNPDRDLRTHIDGWKSEIPAILVVDADGGRQQLTVGSVTLASLDAARLAATD
jgi:thiol-disulfide isomerase/thioredoxin